MRFSLLPTIQFNSVTELTPEFLHERGIRLLMLDFDNTIVPYTTDIPTAQMRLWLEMMLRSDIQVCVVSNSHKARVRRFCEANGIPCVTHARKPFSKGIRECLRRFDIAPQYSALVGDQIYTDTLGANCAGVCSILVRSINNYNVWLKLRHAAELPFIFAARKRRI